MAAIAVQAHLPFFDTYQGNSGSPVFALDDLNAGRLVLQGLLTSGGNDHAVNRNENCRVSYRCGNVPGDPPIRCGGEAVVRASLFREKALKNYNEHEKALPKSDARSILQMLDGLQPHAP